MEMCFHKAELNVVSNRKKALGFVFPQAHVGDSEAKANLAEYIASFSGPPGSSAKSARSADTAAEGKVDPPCSNYKSLQTVRELEKLKAKIEGSSTAEELQEIEAAAKTLKNDMLELIKATHKGVKDCYAARVEDQKRAERKEQEKVQQLKKAASAKAKAQTQQKEKDERQHSSKHSGGAQQSTELAVMNFNTQEHPKLEILSLTAHDLAIGDFNMEVPLIVTGCVSMTTLLKEQEDHFKVEMNSFDKQFDGSDVQKKVGRAALKINNDVLSAKISEGLALHWHWGNKSQGKLLEPRPDHANPNSAAHKLFLALSPAIFGVCEPTNKSALMGLDVNGFASFRYTVSGTRKVIIFDFVSIGRYVRSLNTQDLGKPISSTAVKQWLKCASHLDITKLINSGQVRMWVGTVGCHDMLFLPAGMYVLEQVQNGQQVRGVRMSVLMQASYHAILNCNVDTIAMGKRNEVQAEALKLLTGESKGEKGTQPPSVFVFYCSRQMQVACHLWISMMFIDIAFDVNPSECFLNHVAQGANQSCYSIKLEPGMPGLLLCSHRRTNSICLFRCVPMS